METYRIAAMEGDGIGPEVVDAAVQALKVCAERDGGFRLGFQDFDWGSDYYKKHGVMMPEGGADQLRDFDAILFGAVGAPDIPDHITLWGLRLAICQPLDQYASVREFVARIGRLACGDGWRRRTPPSVTLDPPCRSKPMLIAVTISPNSGAG